MTIYERFTSFRLTPARACLALLLVAAIFVAKRPDAFTRPQFWAEDGAVWYRDAHELGAWQPFLHTRDGYYSTYLRAVAAVGSALPLSQGPLFFNSVALLVMLLPAAYLLSPRFADVADDGTRSLLVLLYALAPNTAETHLNATNAQWHLALAAFLVLLASPPRSTRGRIGDGTVLVLSCLSGPYTVFFVPIALWRWWAMRTGQRAIMLGVVSIGAAIQLSGLLFLSGGDRVHILPDPSLPTLGAILTRQFFLGGTAGVGSYDMLNNAGALGVFFLLLTMCAGIGLVAFAAWAGGFALRALLYLAAITTTASLLYPNLGVINSSYEYRHRAWEWLLSSSSGNRYWLFPVLAFITVIVFSLSPRRPRAVRAIGGVFFLLLCSGSILHFPDPARPDRQYPAHVRKFLALPTGTSYDFPVDPEGWVMRLLAK